MAVTVNFRSKLLADNDLLGNCLAGVLSAFRSRTVAKCRIENGAVGPSYSTVAAFLCGMHSPKYLLSGPLYKKIVNPCRRITKQSK